MARELPFGHDMLWLRGVFVPDGAELSGDEMTRMVGSNPVMIRTVLVPEGGALRGYPYEHIGGAVFIPDEDSTSSPPSGSIPKARAPG